jgi:hypothetical protein
VPVPPKRPDQRRNRNPRQSGDWIVLDKPNEGPIPDLPPIHPWSAETRRWWEAVWRSPMATQWLEADAYSLAILAIARQALLAGDLRVTIAAEVRQMTDDFGLTPKGRQLRRWIVTPEDAERAGYPTDIAELRRKRAQRVGELEGGR